MPPTAQDRFIGAMVAGWIAGALAIIGFTTLLIAFMLIYGYKMT